MARRTITLPGKRDVSRETNPPLAGLHSELLTTTVKAATRVDMFDSRADTHPATANVENVSDDDILEIELEGGVRLWQRVDRSREDFRGQLSRSKDNDDLLIPRTLQFGPTERGATSMAINGLKIIGVDIVDETADNVALAIAEKIEAQLAEDGPGLYRCPDPNALGEKVETAAETTLPLLIFVHGTASSTSGSFGKLTSPESNNAWKRIKESYGERIYAFEHKTLSESPISNAIELARSLPAGATVHLVSHSRGGLVGELICRSALLRRKEDEEVPPFDEADFHVFTSLGRTGDHDALSELNTVLLEKNLEIARFVRVACPARGTTLAGNRLDRYLSIIVNILDWIPGLNQNPIYDLVTAFLMAVVKTRTDPKTIPGLEAQMPTAPLVRMLNRQDIVLDSRLAIIAGDIEGSGFWGTLKVLATDAYFWDDHDLVVNTDAMYGGARRVPAPAFLFHQSADVSHFHYFLNSRTAQAVANALSASELVPNGFEELTDDIAGRALKDVDREEQPSIRGAAEKRPVVFLVPGLMGSNLKQDRKRLWLNYIRLAFGGIERLKIGQAGIEPSSLIGDYYRRLFDFLGESHHVVPFPYDWRVSIVSEAHRLANEIETILNTTDQPVRIVAHSMGGLVSRVMIKERTDVWRRMTERNGCRFVMLGTPNEGSFSIVGTLLGRDRTIRQIETVDITNNMSEIVDIVAEMPGILELLPFDDRGKFFETEAWDAFGDATPNSLQEGRLSEANETRKKIASSPIDPERMCYVAGKADHTPVGVEAEDGKPITILSTPLGDGRVPWKTGIPRGVPAWYMDASHGELANHREGFEAILDLLTSGQTNRLSDRPPAIERGAIDPSAKMQPDEPQLFPSEAEFRQSIFGIRTQTEASAGRPKTRITIAHGNLAFARHPVAVGHYMDDPLLGAERYLDLCLEGKLSHRRKMDVYPGLIETSEIILDPAKKPMGAVIVGLGRYGELGAISLRSTFEKAVLRYALADHERAADPTSRYGTDDEPSKSLSSLLIGHRGSRLTVLNCVTALLEGVMQANEKLTDNRNRIRHLEFIELYEDTAIEAANALQQIKNDDRLSKHFEIEPIVETLPGSRRRVIDGQNDDWWERIQIRRPKKTDKNPDHDSFVFTAFSEGAQTSDEYVAVQQDYVDALAEDTELSAASNQKTGKLLFEQLVPNSLKQFAVDQHNIMYLVDEATAAYPLELFHDGFTDTDPPIAVRASVIRQLILDRTIDRIDTTIMGQNALVVGDPLLDKPRRRKTKKHKKDECENDELPTFRQLEGARKEAELVVDLLNQNDYATKSQIRTGAFDILGDFLLEQYRIVHLAGHGVYDEENLQKSGMVIGHDQFLSPAVVGNMRYVPEFVFLNCCYLGKTELIADEQRDIWLRRHRLAANLGTQFIKSGAKAVIAAGWPVDDTAALTFARTFYQAMFADRKFGDAVRAARQQTYRQHPGRDTWGAYQCYGDPFFTFRNDGKPNNRERSVQFFAAKSQAVVVADNISQNADRATRKYLKRLDDELKHLEEDLGKTRHDWIEHDSEVLVALGRAHGELGDFKKAVSYFEKSLAIEKTETPVRVIEQLANYRVRHAAQLDKDRRRNNVDIRERNKKVRNAEDHEKEVTNEQLIAQIHDAISTVRELDAAVPITNNLDDADETLSTAERCSLLGSAYKRLAQIQERGSDRNESLREMEVYYKAAHELAKKTAGSDADAYPTLNWLCARAVRSLLGRPTFTAEMRHILYNLADKGIARDRADPSYWNAIIQPQAMMIRHLTEGDLPERKDDIFEGMRKAWIRGGSYRQALSALEHLDFLITVVDPGRSSNPERRKKCTQARQALSALRADMDTLMHDQK